MKTVIMANPVNLAPCRSTQAATLAVALVVPLRGPIATVVYACLDNAHSENGTQKLLI